MLDGIIEMEENINVVECRSIETQLGVRKISTSFFGRILFWLELRGHGARRNFSLEQRRSLQIRQMEQLCKVSLALGQNLHTLI